MSLISLGNIFGIGSIVYASGSARLVSPSELSKVFDVGR